MGDAIKYLYSQFILRDVLSFITPGAIVTIAALLLFLHPHEIICLSRSIHWLLYIPIFGVFYIVGFALQCFGELVGIIRFTPYSEKNCCKRWRMFCCDFARHYDKKDCKESNIWWWEEERELSKFYEAASDNTGVQQGHERMVIMKQMCGNGFIAIFLAATLTIFHHFCPDGWRWLLLAWSAVLFASLFWGHRVHMLKQYTRESVFMERRGG